MSIDAIKQELANLDEKRHSEIIAFLVALNERNDAEHRAEITRKIDDKDPSHWMTLEELERRFAARDNEQAG